MIITFKKDAPVKEIQELVSILENSGIKIADASSENLGLFGLIGDTSVVDIDKIQAYSWVIEVTRITVPYKKASRQFHPMDTIVDVCGIKIGGSEKVVIIGGPCSVESVEQIDEIAQGVKAAGAVLLRGGAYKPRTSPYVFQGLETEGINILKKAKSKYGLPIVSEIMSVEKIDEFVENVDVIQIGARNMQNFDLLKKVGKTNKPILLKRGLSNTIQEWLMSAEYILANGNPNVILCERGIRTFETLTRNTLDLSVISIVKKLSHLPIVIDPSHATGHWELVETISLASIVAGCDGLIVEVHNNPEKALSDGQQSLKIEKFKTLVEKSRKLAQFIGRDI
ncbi:MAG: 3-deoxy-7-phosphoheptulonate synthase [Bacilli bacterium]|nr:3-deoxy-7-phosphoheptulonate synthase [Bacilli bacterium]